MLFDCLFGGNVVYKASVVQSVQFFHCKQDNWFLIPVDIILLLININNYDSMIQNLPSLSV